MLSVHSSSANWVKGPKNSLYGRLSLRMAEAGLLTEGSTAYTAHIAETKANSASTPSDHGSVPLVAWPIEMVNTRKVAPIRIEALASAIWLSDRLICWLVRTRWTAWLE